MAREWFRQDNCSLDARDRTIANRAMRHLADSYNLSPTVANLSLVRQCYKEGMTARDLIVAVNEKRGE